MNTRTGLAPRTLPVHLMPFAGCWINSLDLRLAHVLDAEDVE